MRTRLWLVSTEPESKRKRDSHSSDEGKNRGVETKGITKIKDSTIHDNPTNKIDMEGERIKDKINERSVGYTRR